MNIIVLAPQLGTFCDFGLADFFLKFLIDQFRTYSVQGGREN